MSTSPKSVDNHEVVSPMTMASTPQAQRIFSTSREDNAPEVVEPIQQYGSPHDTISPATAAGSAHNSPDAAYSPPVMRHYAVKGDSEKESIHYETNEKMTVMAEDGYAQYPQAVSDLYKPKDEEAVKTPGPAVSGPFPPREQQRKILGLRRRMFFIIIALVCVIIATAVGAGVGVTMANNSKAGDDTAAPPPASESSGIPQSSSEAGEATQSSSPPSSPTSASPSGSPEASASSTPSKSSTASKPSATAKPVFLNQTSIVSGYGFQGFSGGNYHNKYTEIVTEEGGTESGADFEFPITSYQWIARITNCCVSFCNNATDEGWLGYQCITKKQPQTSEGFKRIWVWCEDDHLRPNAQGRCSARYS